MHGRDPQAGYYRRNHHTMMNNHIHNAKNAMNQHQFPPCLWAILFIRLNVPLRKFDADPNVSFWYQSSTMRKEWVAPYCQVVNYYP